MHSRPKESRHTFCLFECGCTWCCYDSSFVSYFRPKHPTKVHVWARISWVGATEIVIFDRKMDAEGFIEVLKAGLLPFVRDHLPGGHRLTMDYDPKHTSRLARAFLEQEQITWWKTPPESPDCNPIENLWHELEGFLRQETNHTPGQSWWKEFDIFADWSMFRNARNTYPT